MYRGWDALSGHYHNISLTSRDRFLPEPTNPDHFPGQVQLNIMKKIANCHNGVVMAVRVYLIGLSGFEIATQWSEAQHPTAGLQRRLRACVGPHHTLKQCLSSIKQWFFFGGGGGVGVFGAPHAPTRGSRGVGKQYTSSYDHDMWPVKILERSGLAVKNYHPETLAAEE